jgi:hypothetical protein
MAATVEVTQSGHPYISIFDPFSCLLLHPQHPNLTPRIYSYKASLKAPGILLLKESKLVLLLSKKTSSSKSVPNPFSMLAGWSEKISKF